MSGVGMNPETESLCPWADINCGLGRFHRWSAVIAESSGHSFLPCMAIPPMPLLCAYIIILYDLYMMMITNRLGTVIGVFNSVNACFRCGLGRASAAHGFVSLLLFIFVFLFFSFIRFCYVLCHFTFYLDMHYVRSFFSKERILFYLLFSVFNFCVEFVSF